MILGRGDKRVKQVFIVPIEDNGDEDLYSHLRDIVGFIGEGTGLTNLIICTYWLSGRAGRENIWPEVMAYGPSAARAVRHDRGPNIFPSGPT